MAAEHKMQFYNDRLGYCDAQIAELVVANVVLSNKRGLLTQDMDDLMHAIGGRCGQGYYAKREGCL